MNRLISLFVVCVSSFVSRAIAQTKGAMPISDTSTNCHTENVCPFAADIDKAAAGKLKITKA